MLNRTEGDVKVEDLSRNPRIAGLMEMMERVEQSRTPLDTLLNVQRGMEAAYGPVAFVGLFTRYLPEGHFQVVQLRLPDAGEETLCNPWDRENLPEYQGGVIGGLIGRPVPQIAFDVDWSADPNFGKILSGYRSLIAVPVVGHRLPMNWMLLLHRNREGTTAERQEETILRAMLIGSLLESRALVQELAHAHAQIDWEVQRVGQIQRSLLPDPLPPIPGLDIAASYETFGEAGGDLYDFIPIGGGGVGADRPRWGIFVGDASGHGPSAAVVIAMVQALLHAHPIEVTAPADLLRYLNEHLCRRPIEGSFVTAFLGIYDPSTRHLTYSNAGHPPPLLKAPLGESMRRLDVASGLPLGVVPSETFEEGSVDLGLGAQLLIYTDGIFEARNEAGAMFGIAGIESAFRTCTGSSGKVVGAVRQAVNTHSCARQSEDDQTLLAISVV